VKLVLAADGHQGCHVMQLLLQQQAVGMLRLPVLGLPATWHVLQQQISPLLAPHHHHQRQQLQLVHSLLLVVTLAAL
jgi:hypothetical protein